MRTAKILSTMACLCLLVGNLTGCGDQYYTEERLVGLENGHCFTLQTFVLQGKEFEMHLDPDRATQATIGFQVRTSDSPTSSGSYSVSVPISFRDSRGVLSRNFNLRFSDHDTSVPVIRITARDFPTPCHH